MTESQTITDSRTIYEPAHPGGPFIAAIFDPHGCIIASQGFPTRAGAEAFLQAFTQEGAGAHGLSASPDAEPYRR